MPIRLPRYIFPFVVKNKEISPRKKTMTLLTAHTTIETNNRSCLLRNLSVLQSSGALLFPNPNYMTEYTYNLGFYFSRDADIIILTVSLTMTCTGNRSLLLQHHPTCLPFPHTRIKKTLPICVLLIYVRVIALLLHNLQLF